MKRAAILIASGVLVLLGAVIVLPSFIDWNRYREDVAGILETALGRDIRLGALSFRLLPQPTLRASDVRVANAPDGESPYFARLEALDVRVAMLPLIRGTVNIQSLGLVAPHLVLETLPDGGNNWTFGESTGEESGGADVQIDALTIDDGVVDYRNLGTGRRVSFPRLNATLVAESLSGPFSGQGTFAYAGVPVAFDLSTGRLADDTGPVSVMAALRLADSGAAAEFSGRLSRAAEGTRAQGMIRVDGNNLNRAMQDIARMTGTAPRALPAAPFAVTATLDAAPDKSVLEPLTLDIDGERLEGRADAALAGEIPHLTIDLSATRIDLDRILAAMPETADANGEAAAPEDFALPETMTVDVALSANAIDLRDEIIRRAAIDLSMRDGAVQVSRATGLFPGGMEAALSGTLQPADGRPRFAGSLDMGARNLRQFLTWTGMDVARVPAGRLAQFDLRGDLTLYPRELRIADLAMSVDSADVTGRFGLSMGETPHVSADLAIDRLPVDAYLPPADPDSGPLDLAPLAAMEADVAVTAGRLSHGDTILNDVTAAFELAAGTLDIGALEIGRWAETRIGGTGRIRDLAGRPTADLRLQAEGRSADRFLNALGMVRSATHAPLGDFSLTGRFQGNREAATLELDGRIAATQLTVAGDIDNLRAVPRLALDFRAENPSVSALAGQLGMDLSPAGDAGPVPAAISGTLAGTADDGDGKLRLDLAGGRFDLTGSYATDAAGTAYDIAVSGMQPEPVRLMRALGLDYEPAGPLGAGELEMTVAATPETVRVERMHLALGDMRVDGSATIDRRGEKPVVTAKLDGTVIDMNALLPPAETGLREAQAVDGASTVAKARARWSREPIDWSGLTAVDADIELTADALEYATYRFVEPALSLSLEDGVLEMAPFSAGLFGGSAELGVTLTAGPPARMDMKVTLEDIAVESLLAATAGNPAATGTARFSGEFFAAGDTQFDMIRGLGGQARFTAANGVIRNMDLPRFSDRLNNLTRMQDFLNLADSALSGGETPYREMTGTVTMENGVARTTDTTADIEAGAATLTATVDLPAWSIDGRGVFRLTEVPGAPPITIDIMGPIDDPNRSVNTRDLRNFVAGRVGAAALKRALGDGQSDGLGDLLGTPREGAEEPQSTPEGEASPLERLLKGFERIRDSSEE